MLACEEKGGELKELSALAFCGTEMEEKEWRTFKMRNVQHGYGTLVSRRKKNIGRNFEEADRFKRI
jgi:hypothetical protein